MSHAPNHLAREVSPYLQQHANNPVDWYPWGDEALALAKRDDKPILLSIGYSACHWCHVMERESFEDDATAAAMNAGYVCIKVDREERPDLDQIYQLVVQLMGRSGGWPLTVFLTPDQKPFFGGTYFPPVDKYGMPSFQKILAAVLDAFRTKRGEIDAQAVEITQAIATATEGEARASGPMTLSTEMLAHAAKRLEGRFDDTHGGFGSRPKFPSTMALSVMLRHAVVNKDERMMKRVVLALDAMRAGGIYDQLGGGFHRYSTDEKWLVPHFEKMLYDNALLLRLYVDGWRATKEARFADTAREIAAYTLREMTHASGAFFSTQDADSEGVEGKFFVWTAAEIRAALGSDQEAADLAIARWGVTDEGNFEETGATVLHQAASIPDLAVRFEKAPSLVTSALERARTGLLAAREKRVKPFRDEKVLACWNGLMIGALADAGAALGDESLVQAAARALSFVKTSMLTPDGTLNRVAKDGVVKTSPAFLDDYAYLADAALDLYEATGDLEHATFARRLGERIVARFWNRETRALYFTPDDGETLIHRAKDPFDHATPSATAIACKALLRLPAAREGEPPYGKVAAVQLEALAAAALENPFGMSESLLAMDRLVRGEVAIVIAGDRKDARAQALARAAHEAFVANRDLVWIDADAARVTFAALADGKGPAADGAPQAYVCRGQTCSLPVTTAAELSKLL